MSECARRCVCVCVCVCVSLDIMMDMSVGMDMEVFVYVMMNIRIHVGMNIRMNAYTEVMFLPLGYKDRCEHGCEDKCVCVRRHLRVCIRICRGSVYIHLYIKLLLLIL